MISRTTLDLSVIAAIIIFVIVAFWFLFGAGINQAFADQHRYRDVLAFSCTLIRSTSYYNDSAGTQTQLVQQNWGQPLNKELPIDIRFVYWDYLGNPHIVSAYVNQSTYKVTEIVFDYGKQTYIVENYTAIVR